MNYLLPQAATHRSGHVAQWILVPSFRTLHRLMGSPHYLVVMTLTIMLFRPPDVQFYWIDRIAVGAMLIVIFLRSMWLQHSLHWEGTVTLPLASLLLLGLWGVLTQPYEAQVWSVFAAKWIVPFIFFHTAAYAFDNPTSAHRLETFMLLVLGYLSAVAILFLAGQTSMIWPRFILNEELGNHVDRARGPFLNAVANGVTLNILGLIALDSFRRKRLRGISALVLLAALPIAILATKTRAVWIAFAVSISVLSFIAPSLRLRRASRCLLIASGLGILVALSFSDIRTPLTERLRERDPLEFRRDLYQAGWAMFLEKPLAGWTSGTIQSELAKRVPDFSPDQFIFHNTYLEFAVEHGTIGIALYAWLMVDLFRLCTRRSGQQSGDGDFLDGQFRIVWPVLLMVYLINARFVVMNYQFVNGLLFTIAGTLAARKRLDLASSSTC